MANKGVHPGTADTPVSALLGADLKRVEYANKLLGLSDDELVDEVNRQVWLSAFANNNPRALAHWKVDLTYDEAGTRGKPWLYQRGYNTAYRSCGYEPSDHDIAAAREPADGPKGQDGIVQPSRNE